MELKYKFSYGNFINYILNQFIIICYHYFAFLALLYLDFVIFGELEDLFSEQDFMYIIIKVISVSLVIIWLIYLIIIQFIPKKAIITSNFIKIKRYFLNFGYFLRGFNDEIYIKDIIECKKYNGKRYRFDRTGPYAVFFFDWDNLVEIKTIDDKCYLVPLKDSEGFIEEINKRLNCLKDYSDTEAVSCPDEMN